MMILKLKPVFFDKIWGGKKLRENYKFNTSDNCGECWGISAHKNGSSTIENGIYKGKNLNQLFDNEKALFGNYEGSEFPILVKVIDATDNLSIQVHPDNDYAKRENSLGKEECWYILDAEIDSDIIIGHNATSKKQLEEAIESNTLENLVCSHPIKTGDFFYINSGTLHAIRKGTTLLEVQQSSDITYRVYDYNRLQDGKPRDLHVKQALDVIKIPDNELETTHNDRFFNYNVIEVKTESVVKSSPHGDYIFIIEGMATFDNIPLNKGDFIMVSANSSYKISGNVKYQVTTF